MSSKCAQSVARITFFPLWMSELKDEYMKLFAQFLESRLKSFCKNALMYLN